MASDHSPYRPIDKGDQETHYSTDHDKKFIVQWNNQWHFKSNYYLAWIAFIWRREYALAFTHK